jgi:preprotein translocase subunit SecB
MNAETTQANDERTFAIQRLYLKDLSFESPTTPQIFKKQWQPNMNLELHTASNKIENSVYEVTLSATITVRSHENEEQAKQKPTDAPIAFLVEVKYAGIFAINAFTEDQEKVLLGSVCPSIIFPYLREVVTDVVNRASFPQLILAPVNFDALYAEHLEQQKLAQTDTAGQA